jgi:hypothetical protein
MSMGYNMPNIQQGGYSMNPFGGNPYGGGYGGGGGGGYGGYGGY